MVKLAVIGAAVWQGAGDLPQRLAGAPFTGTCARCLDQTMRAGPARPAGVLAAQAVIAALDVFWVRLRHARGLRMSREDVREEQKETEGDPQ